MTSKEKKLAQEALGNCIKCIITRNKAEKKKHSVKSLRQLAAASGVEYAIIQKISAGTKDPQFTTLLSIAEALDLSISKLLENYSS